jgi:ankyrin repeat protein
MSVISGHQYIPLEFASAAMCAAAGAGQLGVLTALISCNFNKDVKWPETLATAMCTAAYYGRLAAMQLLVQHGADIKASTPSLGGTALQLAAQMGHTESLRWLLAQGMTEAEVNDALEHAAAGGSVTTVRLLVESGADVEVVGHRALEAALAGGHVPAVVALFEAGVHTNRDSGSCVFFYVDGLRPLLAQCMQKCTPGEAAMLHQGAVDHGQTDLAELVMQAGALVRDALIGDA